MRARVLLLGLEDSVASDLGQALKGDRHAVSAAALDAPAILARQVEHSLTDIVFCGGAPRDIAALVGALRELGSRVPVVVATRLPDAIYWLDALDAGAWDYCTAPFEPALVRRILENALKYPRVLAAAG
jgi:DNA-binding NtrC family response regulator